VSEDYRNDASAIPVTISSGCAKSLHSEHFLPQEVCMCVMEDRHCQSFDSVLGLAMDLDSGRPRSSSGFAATLNLLGQEHIASKRDGCCGASVDE
jgi:hypothetical protein